MLVMDFELKQETLIVRPSGELDLGAADYFRSAVEEALRIHNARNLLYNLNKLSFVDSTGLGVILGRYRKITKNGGKVYIVSPQPQVRKILEISGLLRIMEEFPSENEALAKIG